MRVRLGMALLAMILLPLVSAGGARAAITVANTNDSGPGSLRQAIAEAPSGETIILPAGTYTLTSSELLILKKSLKIEGHGAADTTIRAGGGFRVIVLSEAPEVTISGVTIRDGREGEAPADGAGVLSVNSTLTLRDVVVSNNVANSNGAPGNPGGVAEGAGILSVGTLNLINSRVSDNTATAIGGSGAKGGVAEGAGILVVGPLNVSGSTIANNIVDARGGRAPQTPHRTAVSRRAPACCPSRAPAKPARASLAARSAATRATHPAALAARRA